MNDLETRLREGLHGDVEQPDDVDRFLTGVRRGAAWRRGRRASAGVALVVVSLVGGSALLQDTRGDRTSPRPIGRPSSATTSSPAPPTYNGRVVDLAASGDSVFRLTWNLGCTACSSVWLREASGTWTHLFDFEGRAAYAGHVTPRHGPVDHVTMAANGRDGWAWGRLLWATHDAGRTWSVVSTGPGAHTVYGYSLGVGTHVAWALRRTVSGGTLWRTVLGSDTWQRVTGAPRLRDLSGSGFVGVLDDDRVVLQVSGEGGSDNALVLGSPGAWTQTPVGFGADVSVRTDGTKFWASIPESQGLRMFHLDQGSWLDLGRFEARNWFPLDGQRVLLDRPTAAVLTDHGVAPTDLHPGARILGVSRATDGTLWLLTRSGRVFTSTDAFHWTLAS